MCFFLFSVIFQLSKNSLFQKRGAKIVFFNFQCFKLFFWKFSFFGLLKHYKNRGFSNFWGFLLLKEKKTGKKNDNWNLWILVFLVQKWPFRDAHLLAKTKGPETPIFIVFFGCALSGPRGQKREILKSHQKKIWLITETLIFGYFCCFFFGFFFRVFSFSLFFVSFFVFVCFFGGLKGQVMWPEGPPHLALNPPSFFLFFGCFFLLFFLEG